MTRRFRSTYSAAGDFDWISLTVSNMTGGTIQYCRRSGTVFVEMTGSKSGTSGAVLATLPTGCRPSRQIIRGVQSGGIQAGVYIDPGTGQIRSDFGTGAFGGFSFPV